MKKLPFILPPVILKPQYFHPEKLHPIELDLVLAKGWFRMQQTLFTTDVLNLNEHFYRAVWLRMRLQDLKEDKKYKLLARKNKHFRTEIVPCRLTDLHENLFDAYKKMVIFEPSGSLRTLLYGWGEKTVFKTCLLNIYHKDKLIATGGFDSGEKSAAGIFSVYDPEYKKYSLGKYLIWQKMYYCKQEGFDWFYPGYFVPGYPSFDYKLELGSQALEYYERTGDHWLPFK